MKFAAIGIASVAEVEVKASSIKAKLFGVKRFSNSDSEIHSFSKRPTKLTFVCSSADTLNIASQIGKDASWPV